MSKVHSHRNLLQVWRCSNGVTAIKYALVAGAIATAINVIVASAGKPLDDSFKNTTTKLSGMPEAGSTGGTRSGILIP